MRKLGKVVFTVCLFLFFSQLIVQDYRRMSQASHPFASYFVMGPNQVFAKARTMTLNGLLPKSFNYLLAFAEKKEDFDAARFQEYFEYYRKVAEYMPQRADAYAMLGYCYYHMNRPVEAIVAFQKAADLNPQFSGFHYNLGVIYYKLGGYGQAIESLKKMTGLNPVADVAYIQSSREIYGPFLTGRANSRDYLVEEIRERYQEGRVLLVQCHLRLQQGRPKPGADDKVSLRIF